MPIDRVRIRANGWTQGSFFTTADSDRLIERHAGPLRARIAQPITTLILASHPCDVLSHLNDEEPHVTVFPVLELPNGDHFNPTAIRRPRVWHFEMRLEEQMLRRELLARTGFTVPRVELEQSRSWEAASLPERYAREFPHWLSVRWNRPAFPDAYNDRLRAVQAEIRREIKRIRAPINSVLVWIEPFEELEPDEPYDVELVILMKHEVFENAVQHDEAQAALDRIVGHLRGCQLENGTAAFMIADGVCRVRSMAKMSVAEYNDYLSFGYEELSFRDGGDLPPEPA